RVEHAKCCAACRSQVINTNQRWSTVEHACANGAHLCLLTFILCLQRYLLFASILVKCRAPEIIEYKNSSGAIDLDAFFCQRSVAFAQIRNSAIRAISKSQSDKDGVSIDYLA